MGVQRCAVPHFNGLFKTFKMRYSTFLYSYWIGLKRPFQKSHFTPKKGYCTVFSVHLCKYTYQTCFLYLLACGAFRKRKEWAELSLDQEKLKKSEEGLCTGVIVSDRFALTAAHCVEEGASR